VDVNDIGQAYGSRGNGLTFGWNADMTGAARDRNDPTSPDEQHDSLIHVGSSIWEMAVPNGTYTVHVVVGDPSYADVNSKLTVEGVLTINGSTSSSQRWLEGTTTVTVSDGRLTIGEQAGSYDKIDFIDLTSVGSANQPPTVASAAAASPGSVAATTTNLSVLGADDGGEANLTYTWTATSVPSGAMPAFSVNGTNAAKNVTVTFNKAGSYTFQVGIKDQSGLTTTSSVGLIVNQTLTRISVSPASVTLANGATQPWISLLVP
jgi:PKD domain-containing protein